MALRVVRALFGLVLLLIGLPLLLAGGGLWFVAQHRDDGAYRAPLTDIAADGHAIVASDLDSLLRTDAPFVRAGQTTLRVTAHTDTGPAFIGLAPAARLADYLAGVPHAEVERVRLARGPLPVSVSPVHGTAPPEGNPGEQRFWLAASSTGSLEWTPSEFRGEPVSLVIMRPEGGAPLSTTVVADLRPQWLTSATFGALVLGAVLTLVGIATLVWSPRGRSGSREIVYVVPPAQVPELAAHLGVPAPPGSADPSRTLSRADPGATSRWIDPDRLEWSHSEVGSPEPEVGSDSAATPDLDPWADPDDAALVTDADSDDAQFAQEADSDDAPFAQEADPDGADREVPEPRAAVSEAEEAADPGTGPGGLADVKPAAVERAAVEPAAVERAAVEPAAVERAAVERAAVEPAAVEPAVPVSDGSSRDAAEAKASGREEAESEASDLEDSDPEHSDPEGATQVAGAEASEAEAGSDTEIVDLGEVQVGTAGVGSNRVGPRVVAPRLATASLPPPWPPPAQPWVTAEPAPVPELQKAGQS